MTSVLSAPMPHTRFCLAAHLLGQLLLLLGLILVLCPGLAHANNDDMDVVISRYPAVAGTRLDDCSLCHITITRPIRLNSYGQAYQPNRSEAGLTLIEALDSDGDGHTNLAEIEALTFPGSAADYPAEENVDMTLALTVYPAITGTRLDSCELCHTTGSALNPYGAAYLAGGRNAAAFTAIQGQDSDADSYANLAEIEALTFPGSAADYPTDDTADMDLALSVYPALAGTRLDSCQLCHTTGSALNPYGAAYLAGGRSAAALTAIEALDSDADGFINQTELAQLTFPGNPADYPDDLALFLAAYPALSGTDLDNCAVCHTATYGLNLYGADYQAYGRDQAAFGLIENLDSDGDGHPTADELTLVYFPGDPADYPAHMELLLLNYPQLDNTRLESCDLCHTANWGLNPYGQHYNDHGNNRAAFTAIEPLDSDGDGLLNSEEIAGLTMPGDANDPVQQQFSYRVFLPVLLK